MGWGTIYRRMTEEVPSFFIDLNDAREREHIMQVIQDEFPSADPSAVQHTLEECRRSTLPPRSKLTVLSWLERSLKNNPTKTETL